MKKQKIVYIITKSNFGGAQRYVYELATSLPQDSFDVTVVFGGSGVLKEMLEVKGIKTHTLKSFERDISFFKECKSLFELYTLLNHIKPDIVHLNSSKAGGTGALVSRLLGIQKIIFTAHGWPFHEPRNRVWKSLVWFFSWATVLLAHTTILVSEYDKNHTGMPFIKNKITRIYSALSPFVLLSREVAQSTLFTDDVRALHAHDIWLTTIAELTPNKNILTAIQAVATYNKTNPTQKIFYTVLGDGELYATLHTYIAEHHLEHEVFLAGYIPDARKYLKAFDIFLLPSLKEGMPYALLEAGFAELLVIASSFGGIPEIISHNETGMLIHLTQQNTIVTALLFYANSPSERVLHARALKTKIDTAHTLPTMLTKTNQLYIS